MKWLLTALTGFVVSVSAAFLLGYKIGELQACLAML
jgi:hypothetical protein